MNDPAERLDLEGPSGRLEACLTSPSIPSVARAVVAHPHPLYGGSMDNAVVLETERALLRSGVEVLRFNFRGVGSSEGRHDGGRGEREDLAAAFSHLASIEPTLPILLAGYSFGAAMTLLALDQAPKSVQGVLLLAPPLNHYDFDPLTRTVLPVEILWGEKDDLTPPADLRRLVDGGATLRDRRVEGAAHDLGTLGSPVGLRQALDGALARLVQASSS